MNVDRRASDIRVSRQPFLDAIVGNLYCLHSKRPPQWPQSSQVVPVGTECLLLSHPAVAMKVGVLFTSACGALCCTEGNWPRLLVVMDPEPQGERRLRQPSMTSHPPGLEVD